MALSTVLADGSIFKSWADDHIMWANVGKIVFGKLKNSCELEMPFKVPASHFLKFLEMLTKVLDKLQQRPKNKEEIEENLLIQNVLVYAKVEDVEVELTCKHGEQEGTIFFSKVSLFSFLMVLRQLLPAAITRDLRQAEAFDLFVVILYNITKEEHDDMPPAVRVIDTINQHLSRFDPMSPASQKIKRVLDTVTSSIADLTKWEEFSVRHFLTINMENLIVYCTLWFKTTKPDFIR